MSDSIFNLSHFTFNLDIILYTVCPVSKTSSFFTDILSRASAQAHASVTITTSKLCFRFCRFLARTSTTHQIIEAKVFFSCLLLWSHNRCACDRTHYSDYVPFFLLIIQKPKYLIPFDGCECVYSCIYVIIIFIVGFAHAYL